MLREGHEGVEMTVEEMHKICCWIDLLLPHYGDYPDGMTLENKAIYNKRLAKRTNWEEQEARNIAQYIKDHPTIPTR
ncbi:MAG: hypothetical protein ACYS8Z_15125 [Planctomycetota bacterium]|jgi:hypothetical protein